MKRFAIALGLILLVAGAAWATVSSTTTQVVYTCNGSDTVFPYTFKIFASADLYVATLDTDGVETQLTTGFSVSGVGTSTGGNVTFSTAPAASTTLLLRRQTVQQQNTDLVPNARLNAATLENAYDKLTLIAQDQQNQLNRTVKFKANTAAGSTVVLPEPEALHYLVWNADATGLENADTGISLADATFTNITATTFNGVTLSSFGTSWLDEASASTARSTLGLGTIATQNSNAVSISGGAITGITDLAVADGGTGASSASSARTNLGLGTGDTVIFTGLEVTHWLNSEGGYYTNSVLLGTTRPSGAVIFDTGCTVDGGIYSGMDISSADAANLTITNLKLGSGAASVTSFGISLIDDSNNTAARSTLGLGSIATQAASSVSITGGSLDGVTIGGSTPGAGTFTTAISNAAYFTDLYMSGTQLQAMATQSNYNVDINGGYIDGTIIGYNLPELGYFSDLSAADSADLTEVTMHGICSLMSGWLTLTGTDISNGNFITPILVNAEAQNLTVTTGGFKVGTRTMSSFVETTIDDTDASAFRNTLGIGTADTVGFGAVTAASKGVIVGDATTGRAMRFATLDILDSSVANKVQLTLIGDWNGDSIGSRDIAKGDSSSGYSLTTGGNILSIWGSGHGIYGLSGTPQACMATINYNSTGTAVTVVVDVVHGNEIMLKFYNATTGAAVDLTSLVDTGGGNKEIGVQLFYITASS